MEVAIYDCEWYSAPPRFRKLMLMFMIRCKRPTTVEAKPFYQLNFALLMKVCFGWTALERDKKGDRLIESYFQMTNNVYMVAALARKLFLGSLRN